MAIYCECCKRDYKQIIPHYRTGKHQRNAERLREQRRQEHEEVEDIREEIVDENNGNGTEEFVFDPTFGIEPPVTEDRYEREEKEAIHECTICYMEYTFDEFVKLDCGHKYCKNCLQHTFKIKIEEKKVRKIICPCDECKEVVTFHKMKEILEKEMFEKYDSALLQDTFVNDEEFIYCPVPDCGNPICGMKDHPKIICRKCDKKICFNCKTVGWHKGKCEMKCDEGVAKWMKENNAKPCPNCSVPIEKNKGCDHVMCINCKHHFWWSKPTKKYTGTIYVPATETEWNERVALWDAHAPVAPVVPVAVEDGVGGMRARIEAILGVGRVEAILGRRPVVRRDFAAERRVREARALRMAADRRRWAEQAMQRLQRNVANEGGIVQGVAPVYNEHRIMCAHCDRVYPEKGWRTHIRTQKHRRNRGH